MNAKYLKCKFIFIFIYCQLVVYSQEINHTLNSNKKIISLNIDKRQYQWTIDIEKEIEIFHVYCSKNSKHQICFNSGTDSLTFDIFYNKSVTVNILYEGKCVKTKIICNDIIPNNIDTSKKLYALSKLWSEAKYNFVNMDQLFFDWDSLYLAVIPKVINSKNDYEFYNILLRFYSSLRDGHSNVYNAGEFYMFRDYIPISLDDIDNNVYITRIRKGCSLDSSFLGAKIIELFNLPINDYLQDSIMPLISSTTEHVRFSESVVKIQSGFKNSMFVARVQKRDGTIQKIKLKYNGEETRTQNDSYYGRAIKYNDKSVYYANMAESIAYVAIRRFSPEKTIINQLSQLISTINKSKGLIIDLRNNGGGSTSVAWYLQSLMTSYEKNWFLNFGWQTRINDGIKKANSNWKPEYKAFYLDQALRTEKPDTIFISDTTQRIKIPIVILVNKYTASAAEDLLINLYELPKRPVIIGEKTCGTTGSPLVISNLSNEWYARVCTRRVLYPYSMKPFFDGIKPDIEVSYTLDELMSDKDKELDIAIAYFIDL